MKLSPIKIEYKKLASFLKDYIRMMSRGWVFLILDEEYKIGKTINFSIRTAGLDQNLEAEGTVVYCGDNESGEKGIGLKLVFESESQKFLSEKLNDVVIGKYGNVWGTKFSSLCGGKL